VAVQEGGGYGTKYPPFLEQLEGDLPDAFISWGSASHSRGLVGGVAAARGISRRRSSRGHLLLLLGPTTSASKDFATIGRLPTSSYANDLCSLIDELPEWIQREVVVRTKSSFAEVPRKDRISQSKILGTRRVTLDSGTRTIGSVLRDTRLAVVTYHESLAPILISRGVPTILFWNSEYVASSASSRRVLAGLAKSGMYFSDPIQCGRHVGKIFDDPTAWWKSGPVCHARSEYEAAFATPVRSPGFGIGRLLQRETVESRSRETQ
jgi:putative transferase (TIGR04331 family)